MVIWGPCHRVVAGRKLAVGGDILRILRVATNMLKKHSRTADNGRSSCLRVGQGANNS